MVIFPISYVSLPEGKDRVLHHPPKKNVDDSTSKNGDFSNNEEHGGVACPLPDRVTNQWAMGMETPQGIDL